MASPPQGGLDLKTVRNELSEAVHKTYEIGIQLGIPHFKMVVFKNDDDPLSSAIEFWLRGNVEDAPVTWTFIVQALKSSHVQENGVAERIAVKYCRHSSVVQDDDHKPAAPAEQQRNLRLEKVQEQYANYVDRIQIIINEKGISANRLRSYLLNLPATSHSDKEKKVLLLSGLSEDVIDKLFISLSSCTSYLDYDIYEKILKRFCPNESHEDLNYPAHLRDYIDMHTIDQFVRLFPNLNDPYKLMKLYENSKEMKIKFGFEGKQTLRTLKVVTGAVTNILGIEQSSLQLYNVKKGCVLATFLLHVSIADAIFTVHTAFTVEQICAFRVLSLLWLECNGFKFDFSQQTEVQTLCSDAVKAWQYACQKGLLNFVRVLAFELKMDTKMLDNVGRAPLHYACERGHLDVVKALVSKLKTDMSIQIHTPLHVCEEGQFDVASEFQSSLSIQDHAGCTPLHLACKNGHSNVAKVLVSEVKTGFLIEDHAGCTPLVYACENKHLEIVKILVFEFMNTQKDAGRTLFLYACEKGLSDVVKILASEFHSDISILDDVGSTPLHYACGNGLLGVAKILVSEIESAVSTSDKHGRNPLHYACKKGHFDIARALAKAKADILIQDHAGCTPLVYACENKHLEIVKVLVFEFMNTQEDAGHTLFLHACEKKLLDVVKILASEFPSDISILDDVGRTPLHYACEKGLLNVVKALVSVLKTDMSMQDFTGRTPLHYACLNDHFDVVRVLLPENKVDLSVGDDSGHTAVMLAAAVGHDPNIADHQGQTPLHYACKKGSKKLICALIGEYKADVNVCDKQANTPLHVAASAGQHEVVLALIREFGSDPSTQGHLGRTPLHLASQGGHPAIVEELLNYTSPFVTDDAGNTPLHLASEGGDLHSMQYLLDANAAVLIRNKNNQTSIDIAQKKPRSLLEEYVKANRQEDLASNKRVSELSKKRYFGSHYITRMFVLGNSGSGKSSFIESFKKEKYLQQFWKVTESSVPPHTAGIIPSVHMSSQYGRILFYDFAGNAEYYTSRAPIFESLAHSREGSNIFIVVVDMRDYSSVIKNALCYWFSFIQYQRFRNSSFVVIGSHLDQVVAAPKECLEEFCTTMQPMINNINFFMMDCRNPRSNEIALFKSQVFAWVSKSLKCGLSSEARLLLGLLEKDFSAVTACPVQTLVSHIKESGVWLPVRPKPLYQILLELHEVGVLMLLGDCNNDTDHVILNIFKLTNEVHELLFVASACSIHSNFNFNIGILPDHILNNVLPQYITKECLIHLQYCHKISCTDVGIFSSLKLTDSTSQSFLFFPALCSADKGEVSWDKSTGHSFNIGWLALCTDPHDYFPPRFLHVLLLRLVHRFTLSVSAQLQTAHAFPEHSRRCTMWKNGVHWKMEEGVDCMVELVNGSKGVVVLTKSAIDGAEDCVRVFTKVVSCVMEAKAEFCYSTKPEFFLLDSSAEADYLNEDYQFAVSDVERALETEGKRVVISVSGRRGMELAKLDWMLSLTLWNSLFPFQLNQVLLTLKVRVREIFDLGLCLDAPYEFLDFLRVNFSSDVDQRKTQLMRWWMKNSPKPPCWHTLVEALKDIDRSTLAKEIREKHSLHIQLQEKLLCEETQALKPDEEFLHSLSGVVGSRWPSLAVSLELSHWEIEELKGKVGVSHQELALQMLKIWASREKATYGQLFHKLKTISMFQNCC